MVREFKYIIKRIIIGVGIVLALMFIKGNLIMSVSALDYNADEYQVCGTGYGCTTQSTLPVTNSYGNEMYGYYYTLPFTNGHTYSINFYIIMYAKDLTINSGWPKMYLYSNNSTTTIIPDRYENLYVSYIGADRYAVTWSFELDVVGDFVGCQFRMKYNSNFQNTFTYTGIHDMQLSITDLTITGGSSNDDIINNNNQNTQSIINNQNNNTNNIINNNTQNTQNIINNQNSNTDKEIESQKVCIDYDNRYVSYNGYINSSGEFVSSTSSVTKSSDFISVYPNSSLTVARTVSQNYRVCFYDSVKNFISCTLLNNLPLNSDISIPSNASYFRYAINFDSNRPILKYCYNGNQAIVNSQQDINNTLNNDNVDTQQAGDFFSNFQTDSHGLSGVISSPLRLIQSLSSSQCSPLVLPLPFVNQSATIPCMSTVYSKFPTFYNLWQLISTGLIAYYILINLFGHVKGMQNPQDDRIEVLNL